MKRTDMEEIEIACDLEGKILGFRGHVNYDLGAYTTAWNDVFVSNTIYTNSIENKC
mgnify:CR=1 FL=1